MATFRWNGLDIYYEEYGEGDPILILNGIMMSCASWTEFIEPLSSHNRLLLLDLADQGKSGKMPEEYSQEVQTDVVVALLDHLGIEKVNIAGLSYGSEVALRLAVKNCNRINRLVLWNTTSRTFKKISEQVKGWNLAMGDPEAYYMVTIPTFYSHTFYEEHGDWIDARHATVRDNAFANKDFMDSMRRLTNSSEDLDVSEKLGNITAPTLIITCLEDYLTPMREQQLLAERIPNSHYVWIPNVGHCSMYEEPVLFTTLTLGFINNSKMEYHIV